MDSRTSAVITRVVLPLALVVTVIGCQSNPTPRPVSSSPVPNVQASATANKIQVPRIQAEAGDTVIRLSWPPIAGSHGYFVFRDNGTAPLNPTPMTATQFQDIGLTNGRTYTYTIAIVNPDGQMGPRSEPVQAAPKSH